VAERVAIGGSYNVAKASEPDQNVFGWFSVAALADGSPVADREGDVIPIEELEKASHEFVRFARASGVEHNGEDPDGELITSIVFSDDIIDALSTDGTTGEIDQELASIMKARLPRGWFGGFHIPDPEVWSQTLASGKSSFSIEGYADETEESR